MVTRMQQRRGTATQWGSTNPILGDGEIGYEKDTGLMKVGDGTSRWRSLPYAVGLDRDLIALEKTARQGRRGINVAGAEFSSSNVIWENPQSFVYLASRGIRLIRLPFLWESIQPTLSAPLSAVILAGLHATVDAAGAAGLKVVIDVHNYGLFNNIAYGDTGSFTQANFVDLWTRLSKEFANDPAVIGYGLMNEPRGLPGGSLVWQAAQQAVLNAIRALDDTTCVLIGGYASSSLGGWFTPSHSQLVPFITDPAQNYRYEAHHYWDTNGLGTYPNTYAAEVTANASWGSGDTVDRRVMFELNKWIGWLKNFGIRGYIGEYGWPSTATADTTSAAAWNALGEKYLARIEAEGDLLWGTAWATGSRWSEGYSINYYDDNAGVLATPRSNATPIENHKEKGVIGQGSGVASAPSLPAFSFDSGAAIFPFSPVGTTTSNTHGNGTLRCVPFYISSPITINKLGVEVTAAGEAGSTIRLGIYSDSGMGKPSSLIVDAGTVSGAAVAVAEVTLATPLTLQPGWYWLAAVVQNAPTTQPTVRAGTTPVAGFLLSPGNAAPSANAGIIGYSNSGVTGALPTAFSQSTAAGLGNMARIHLRVA